MNQLLEPVRHKTLVPQGVDVVEYISENGWWQKSNYHLEGNTVVRNEGVDEVGNVKELYIVN